MNKTEAAYSNHLHLLQMAGEILWFRFEGVKLKISDRCFYTPDFIVFRNDRLIECHEVKGHWEDDARVKIKAASEMYPFRFVAVKPSGKGWKEEVFE